MCLRYAQLVCYSKEPLSLNELKDKLYCMPTPTFIAQVARVVAACAAGSSLLMEGPPGRTMLLP